MTELSVRVVADGELRAAATVFRRALHRPAVSAETWPLAATSYQPGRTFGAFLGDELVGSASSFASRLAVPGGAVLPMAAVSRVGVRADRTRRGALTALMTEQLRQAAADGEVVASLRASETTIYGRFGYGIATRAREVTVPAGSALRPAPPTAGEIRQLDAEDVAAELASIYARFPLSRAGMVDRPDVWWTATMRLRPERDRVVAVHDGVDGPDGFVVYHPQHAAGEWRPTLEVDDLQAADPAVALALWRFLCGIDLVRAVRAELRPLDEPLEWLFADFRAVRTVGVLDETWLRLVDVPAALAARTFGEADPVVLAVTDPLLPANSGRYRIGPDGVSRTDDAADLTLDVAVLGSWYLGDTRPSTVAAAGAVTVHRADAVARADRLFGTADVPWCGTFF